MIKQQLIQARDLIKQKRYDDARAILHTIEHPTARQWLDKLNKIAPPDGAAKAAKAEPVKTKPPADTRQIKALMLEARDLIIQKDYDAARAILEQIDHPKAKDWLDRLTILITAPIAPPRVITEDLSSHAKPAPDPATHDAILRQAQEALLRDQYEQARALLKPLKTPEAAFWLEKTGMTRFRTYENIWLDMFRYALPPKAKQNPESWACSTCGRGASEALTCPQRDQNPCPVKISARHIEEPRRLALLLQALYLEQYDDIEKIMVHIDTARLAHWRTELKWQLENMDQVDVRRTAIEEAVPMLDRHIKMRLTESKQAVMARSESPAQQLPSPSLPVSAQPPSPQRAPALASIARENPLQPQVKAHLREQMEEPILRQIVNTIIHFFINQ